jgi:hypothetical protein
MIDLARSATLSALSARPPRSLSPSVRRAQPADLAAVTRLINRAHAVEAFFVDGERVEPAEVAALRERGHFLVLDGDAGDLAAAIYVRIDDARGTIGLLSVAPDHQGAAWAAAWWRWPGAVRRGRVRRRRAGGRQPAPGAGPVVPQPGLPRGRHRAVRPAPGQAALPLRPHAEGVGVAPGGRGRRRRATGAGRAAIEYPGRHAAGSSARVVLADRGLQR